MTLSWNIRGEMNTQKMSYTNAALRSADATCQNTVLGSSVVCTIVGSLKL
jgi:hypothetical protein